MPAEHQTQLNYAAVSYAGGVPAHVKRIKAQMLAKAEREKATEEEARAKAEAVKAAVQKEIDYNKRL